MSVSNLKALIEHGVKDYREVLFKPYRVIYEVEPKRVSTTQLAQ